MYGEIWLALLSAIICALTGLFLYYMHNTQPHPYKILTLSILGVVLFLPLIVYTMKYFRRIGYVYEYMLFFHDLLVDEEINQATEYYSAPIKISTIKFDHPKYCERTDSGLFRLCEEPVQIPQIESSSLLNMLRPHCNTGFYTSRELTNAIMPKNSVVSTVAFVDNSSPLCLICFDKPPDSFFLPCGNAGICSSCGEALLKNSATCHLCRSVCN